MSRCSPDGLLQAQEKDARRVPLARGYGIERTRLRPGDESKGRTAARGHGKKRCLPTLPRAPPVSVQFQNSGGECEASVYGVFIKKNGDGEFGAKPDLPVLSGDV